MFDYCRNILNCDFVKASCALVHAVIECLSSIVLYVYRKSGPPDFCAVSAYGGCRFNKCYRYLILRFLPAIGPTSLVPQLLRPSEGWRSELSSPLLYLEPR